jgi:hypothetical protein
MTQWYNCNPPRISQRSLLIIYLPTILFSRLLYTSAHGIALLRHFRTPFVPTYGTYILPAGGFLIPFVIALEPILQHPPSYIYIGKISGVMGLGTGPGSIITSSYWLLGVG